MQTETELLTLQEAADILSVPKAYLISLIDSKALPCCEHVYGEPRIQRAAVLTYKAEMTSRQARGLDAMVAISSSLGLYDAEIGGLSRPDGSDDLCIKRSSVKKGSS
ncbi:MAG: helix-turn-helix domain-containing protein [Telluria sp.]